MFYQERPDRASQIARGRTPHRSPKIYFFSYRGPISAPNFDASETLGAAIGLDGEPGTSRKKEGKLVNAGDA